MNQLTKWTQLLFVSGVGLLGCVTVSMCHQTECVRVCVRARMKDQSEVIGCMFGRPYRF